jgi:hypothetical protein
MLKNGAGNLPGEKSAQSASIIALEINSKVSSRLPGWSSERRHMINVKNGAGNLPGDKSAQSASIIALEINPKVSSRLPG